MLFEKGVRPALGWLLVLCLCVLGRGSMAAQLVLHEQAQKAEMIALDERERQWIRDNPRVTVASVQYPLYLFQDEHGRWNGLNNDVLNRITAMTGLQFVHEESFSTDQML